MYYVKGHLQAQLMTVTSIVPWVGWEACSSKPDDRDDSEKDQEKEESKETEENKRMQGKENRHT